jgi:hypothetical protein
MRTFLFVTVLTAASGAAWSQGVERWPVKTSVPDGTNFSKAAQVALTDLLALPDAPGVGHDDAKYQSARIPAKAGDKFSEGQLLTTTGWLHLVAGETDGDYHIQISDSDSTGDHCLIVEVPNPDPKFTASADLQPKFAAVRDLIKTKMLAGKDPSVGGSVLQHPVYDGERNTVLRRFARGRSSARQEGHACRDAVGTAPRDGDHVRTEAAVVVY